MGLKRRQYLPRRAFAGAAVLFTSGTGMGAVPDSNQEPLDVRLGNASRGRNHGRTGKVVGAGGAEGWDLICHRPGKSRGRAALSAPCSCAVTEMGALARQALKGFVFPALTRP